MSLTSAIIKDIQKQLGPPHNQQVGDDGYPHIIKTKLNNTFLVSSMEELIDLESRCETCFQKGKPSTIWMSRLCITKELMEHAQGPYEIIHKVVLEVTTHRHAAAEIHFALACTRWNADIIASLKGLNNKH